MTTYSTQNKLAKVIISSDTRNLSAIFVGNPSNWGDDGNLFINIGNGAYDIPTELFFHPQSWRGVIEESDPEYSDNETYFSHFFSETGEVWNVCHFYQNDRGDNDYRDVIHYKIKYNGTSSKNLFELIYNIYNIKVFVYDDTNGEVTADSGATYTVKSFENDGSANLEHCIEDDFELIDII